MIPPELPRKFRNDPPMAVTLAALGREGSPPTIRDGRFVFLCPHCGEMLGYINPKNNLAREAKLCRFRL